jgi:hypothetical protein
MGTEQQDRDSPRNQELNHVSKDREISQKTKVDGGGKV